MWTDDTGALLPLAVVALLCKQAVLGQLTELVADGSAQSKRRQTDLIIQLLQQLLSGFIIDTTNVKLFANLFRLARKNGAWLCDAGMWLSGGCCCFLFFVLALCHTPWPVHCCFVFPRDTTVADTRVLVVSDASHAGLAALLKLVKTRAEEAAQLEDTRGAKPSPWKSMLVLVKVLTGRA